MEDPVLVILILFVSLLAVYVLVSVLNWLLPYDEDTDDEY